MPEIEDEVTFHTQADQVRFDAELEFQVKVKGA